MYVDSYIWRQTYETLSLQNAYLENVYVTAAVVFPIQASILYEDFKL